jgi:hypothetical protein
MYEKLSLTSLREGIKQPRSDTYVEMETNGPLSTMKIGQKIEHKNTLYICRNG